MPIKCYSNPMGIRTSPPARAGIAKKSKAGQRGKSATFFPHATKLAVSRSPGIKGFCEAYAVTHDTFTRLSGFSPRAVANWAQGHKPSESTERRLSELTRLFAALEKVVNPEVIGPWLKEPNPAFDG